ncbi:MAG: membrane-associated phospholipid phosphatase [Oceanicoccus sp.]|jgi:membrane-associated phospholipid phosphatase
MTLKEQTMNELQQLGIEIILALQSYQSPLIDSFFNLASQLGAFGYLFVVPLVVWCIEPRVGVRALLAMLISQYIVFLIKDIVQEPRPFQVDTRIISNGEQGYSFPSSHAMGAMVFYGLMALASQQRWLWWLLAAIIFFIGLSRNYFGVNFPHDVIVGWLLGMAFIAGWIKLEHYADKNLRYMQLNRQIIWSFIFPLMIGLLHYFYFGTVSGIVVAGTVTACLISLAIDRKNKVYSSDVSLPQKVGRYAVGALLIMIVMILFRKFSPDPEQGLYNTVVWLNGFILVFTISFIAPKLFYKLRLV